MMLRSKSRLIIIQQPTTKCEEPPVVDTDCGRLFHALSECLTSEAKIACMTSVEVRARLQAINKIVRQSLEDDGGLDWQI